jgi:ATP-dependent DNA helicase RecG
MPRTIKTEPSKSTVEVAEGWRVQEIDPEQFAAKKEMLAALRGVSRLGPKRIEMLIDAGFESVEDLALHFPSRYIDARELVPLKDLRKHLMKPVSVRGKVLSAALIPGRRRARAAIVLRDQSGGLLQLVYFDFPEWRTKQFKKDEEYLVIGYVGSYKDTLQIVQPPFVEQLERPDDFARGQILPLYTLPAALRKEGFRDKQFREIVATALKYCDLKGHFDEVLPRDIMERDALMPRREAIMEVHHPQSPERLEGARRRLKYEELFFLQLRLAVERRKMRQGAGNVLRIETSKSPLREKLLASLPYKLTNDQQRTLSEILADMSKANGRSYPMNRLLQGDVGSGKTIVALLAMLAAIEQGYQCAFMAPTEVLAQQHYYTLTNLLKDTPVQTILLVGGQGAKERKSVLNAIASGAAHIVVGTHALIQKGVVFHSLGLIVTDEQHRFGVEQRKALIQKAETNDEHDAQLWSDTRESKQVTPDVLIMSATPIPRTLALTLYGDMEVSTIRELPVGRKPIKTMLLFEHDHPKIYEAARKRIRDKKEQVFIVYPLREKSEKSDSAAAEKAYDDLRLGEFRDFRVALVHGKTPDKHDVMRRFREHEFDVLVATTVIEVGVDVPNATVMIIEHADKFGLAQLHQLRGRVGRGSADSACVLVASEKLYIDPNADMQTSEQLETASLALARLQKLVATSDGFELAKADLEMRGTGEILGTKQSGKVALKVANLALDTPIVEATLRDADDVAQRDPELREAAHEATRTEFLRRYRDAESYLHVG